MIYTFKEILEMHGSLIYELRVLEQYFLNFLKKVKLEKSLMQQVMMNW